MKRILLACGTGIVTSTAAAHKLRDLLEKRGKLKEVEIVQCKVAEIASKADDFDLVVSTTQVAAKITTPVVMGLPFLTGVGVDKTVDQIIEILGI